jgi:hypothetical protein
VKHGSLEPEVVHQPSTSEDNHDAQVGGTHPTSGGSEPGDQAEEEDVPVIFFGNEGT